MDIMANAMTGLPDAVVGLPPRRLGAFDNGGELPPAAKSECATEALKQVGGVDHCAGRVELELVACAVADPYWLRGVRAGEMRQLDLVGNGPSIDRIHELKAESRIDSVTDEVIKVACLRAVPEQI